MVRLLVLLCGGLFLTLLIAGRDTGQVRMGLTGAHDLGLTPLAAAPVPAEAVSAPAAVATNAAAAVPRPQPNNTAVPVAFSPAPAVAGLQDGLTLALPLAAPATADPAAAPGPASAGALAYVIGNNVNVREGPSARAAVLDRLSRGEAVSVLGASEPGWTLIRIEGDGVEGYIATRYLSARSPDGTGPVAD